MKRSMMTAFLCVCGFGLAGCQGDTMYVVHGGGNEEGGTNSPSGGDETGGDSGGDSGGDETGGDSGGNSGGDETGGDSGGDSGVDPGLDPSIPRDVVGGLASWLEKYSCVEGDSDCQENTYSQCKDYHYYISEFCSDESFCDEDLGCIECIPDWPFCKGNDVYQCSADGKSSTLVKSCELEPCLNGKCQVAECPADTQFIYLVDSSYNLLKFDPGASGGNYFEVLHRLSCGNTSSTPFSMAVDRDAKAWVLYQDSTLYKVDVKSGSCEKVTNFRTNGSGLSTFGMAFSLDTVGGETDSLYIGDTSTGGAFGHIDTETMAYTRLASFSSKYEQTPELTGTGLAKLYAFSPGQYNQYISEVDKATGNVVQEYTLPGTGGYISAWAFAHWGGYFFAFETYNGKNRVHRFNIENHSFEVFVDNSPYRIVGAGVSTCAPVVVN